MGGLEGLDPPAGSRGGAPGGVWGEAPCVRDCSGNPASSVLPPLNGRGTTVPAYHLLTVYLRWLPRNWSEKPDPGALRRGNAQNKLNKYKLCNIPIIWLISSWLNSFLQGYITGKRWRMFNLKAGVEASTKCPQY